MDEGGAAAASNCSSGRCSERRVERRILFEDRLLELAERAAGLDTEFVDERRTRLLIGLERLRLPSGAVEREHQLGSEAFSERVLADERFQLAHELGVVSGGEVVFDSLLEAGET